MAFILLLVLAGASLAFYMRVNSHEKSRQSHSRSELIEQVRSKGPERRLRYLRRDIDESSKWLILSMGNFPLDKRAHMIYNENGARLLINQLRHGTPAEKTYATLALEEDANYVFSKSAHLDSSIARKLGGTTSLRQELETDAMSNGPGSPAETAKAVVSAYESLARPGAPHYRVWREAFEGVLGMRAAAHVASGFATPNLDEVNRVLRFTSVGPMGVGCLGALALGVVWLESSEHQRSALRSPEALETVARTVLRAVGTHHDYVLLETVHDLTAQAKQFLISGGAT